MKQGPSGFKNNMKKGTETSIRNTPKRIAFLLHDLSPYRVPLYERLSEREIEIHIFCQNISKETLTLIEGSVKLHKVVSVYQIGSIKKAILRKTGIPLPTLTLLAALKKFTPDAVVMEGMSNVGNDLLSLFMILPRRIPFVWWSLGHIPSQSHTLRARAGVPIQKWFLKHAASILAYSTFAKRYVISLGAKPNNVYVVKNTLDETQLVIEADKGRAESPAIRKTLGLDGRPVAVFIGRINEGKRLDLLIDAFSEVILRMKTQNPALLIIGDGPSLQKNIEYVVEKEQSENIIFVGNKSEDASVYLSLGHVCIIPGLGGLAINHAFAHRIPVICGRADGCEEDLVFTGETGIRLNEVNVATLADAIYTVLSDPEKSVQMGQNAYKLVTETVTMDHFADQVMNAANTALKS